MRLLDAVLTLVLFTHAAAALPDGEHKHARKSAHAISSDEHAFGREGDPKKVSRTVSVGMDDQMRFTPDALAVKQDETVRFRIRNSGKTMHEMVLGTMDELKKHAELMRKHSGMEHDEPYMAHVAPGKTETMVWQFTKPGEFHYGCLVAGHFEAGMVGRIRVAAASGEDQRKKAAPPAQSSAMSEGEVRKVDKDAKKITIKHGPLQNLDMPAMTMVFQVADPAMLNQVKSGDKVNFRAEKIGGAYALTKIEPAK
jgi:uncharacterized cupredoxin-like copper-binding protein